MPGAWFLSKFFSTRNLLPLTILSLVLVRYIDNRCNSFLFVLIPGFSSLPSSIKWVYSKNFTEHVERSPGFV